MRMKNILALLTALFLLVTCMSFSVMAAGSEINFADLVKASGQDEVKPLPGDIVIPIPPTPVPPEIEDEEITDLDGNGELTTDDAVYLLLYVMFDEDEYPLPAGANVDYDGDGRETTDDAVYLLLYVMFGEDEYPLYPAA